MHMVYERGFGAGPLVCYRDPEYSWQKTIPAIDDENTPGPRFPWPQPVSKAKKDWEFQKKKWNLDIQSMDSAMDLVGLEGVKTMLVEIVSLVATAGRQQGIMTGEDRLPSSYKATRFGAIFIGNPGTGKTTVAKLYAKFLYSRRIISNDRIITVAGPHLASGGVQGCDQYLDSLDRGGVLLIEDAHHLVSSSTSGGTAILDYLMTKVEEFTGKAIFIFTGHGKRMETFSGHTPALRSLIPNTVKFPDFEDRDLHLLLIRELKSKFGENMRVEGGYYGLYMRIVVRRIGRSRGGSSFGNAREVQNALSLILKRQATRIFGEAKANKAATACTGDLYLTKADLIGPPPSTVFETSRAWKKLQRMIGLKAVKEAVGALVYRLQLNYDRELAEKPLVECSLNKLFLGNPGTGKTTVAKLYGQILADIGLLSNGEVVLKNPSDLIGDALGGSERNTKAILDSTKGKVLIIDEAYMLGGSNDGSIASVDSFRSAVVDTIVAEVQSTAVEDRCVLLLGYREQMENMLNNGNQALARRFPLATAFNFDDYSAAELRDILSLKLDESGFRATDAAMEAAVGVLDLARNRPGFGNGGEVDILLNEAKIRHHRRLLDQKGGDHEADLFEPQDMDEDFDRANREPNIRELFSDFVGCEPLIEKLEGYQRGVKTMKLLGIDPREEIPFTFLFRGPPGTGKTTTAKKMGAVYYHMGFLQTDQVQECSATDLIGEYVGHTGPKTKKLFDSALGRVLFIDEAYKLGEGCYGKEAMIEMVNNLTRDKYRNKLVVILAGYEHEINKLMSINPGLTSRFPESINFNHISADHCIEVLFRRIKSKSQKLDVTVSENSQELKSFLRESFRRLSQLPGWANARDVQTLANAVFRRMVRGSVVPSSWAVPEEFIIEEVNAMINERKDRAATSAGSRAKQGPADIPLPTYRPTMPRPPPVKTKVNVDIKKDVVTPPSSPQEEGKGLHNHATRERIDIDADENEDPSQKEFHAPEMAVRDPGVPDDVWDQLQHDKQAAKRRRADLENARRILSHLSKEEAKARAKILEAPLSQNAESWRQRLKHIDEMRKKTEEAMRAKEEEEQREREFQRRLQSLGVCPLGYEWLRQKEGYRCAGGTHYLTFDEIRKGYSYNS